MLEYFAKFPTTLYDIAGNKIQELVIDITHRAAFKKIVENNSYVYYPYDVKDGETPEVIAHKYYGDSKFHWVILLSNNIQHPFFDWPLSYTNLNATLEAQFSSIRQCKLTLHSYLDIAGNVIDKTTYDSLPDNERSTLSLYDYYFNINESKRRIKILDKIYLAQVDAELTSILQ